MKIGIANKETWIFLDDIHTSLQNQYPTTVFEPVRWPLPLMHRKMSHYLLRNSLKQFLRDCDVAFFEWASEFVVEATDVATEMEAHAGIVVRLHRYEMFQWTHRINWQKVDCVILDTEAMRRKLLARTDLPPDRAIVIPPVGLPQEIFATEQRPFRGNIGILSNLIPRKRVYELILAFAGALREYPDLHLHIGGGERPHYQAYYEALHFLIDELGIRDHVTFYGRVDDRWTWYRTMDIFVSFSYSEGMQVAPLEAAASGCFCVSHRWDGADEIFSTEQLFLTEDEFIQRVLRYCYATDEERQSLRNPLVNFVTEMCDLGAISTRIQQVLEEVARDRIRINTRSNYRRPNVAAQE